MHDKKSRDVYVATLFVYLVGVPDIMADVEAGIDLLAWVEDIVWIKEVFGYFEKFKHLFSEHFV